MGVGVPADRIFSLTSPRPGESWKRRRRTKEEGGREDRFNEDSCCDGSSRPLCGHVNKPGRQMG